MYDEQNKNTVKTKGKNAQRTATGVTPHENE